MYKEETLTQTAPTQRKNNLRRRTKHTDKKEIEKKPGIKMGYGACSVSGCNCKSYMGSADTCENCGHNYGLHW
jgi:translation initiation factor 2 gamma subunit (eIF-2gamma)